MMVASFKAMSRLKNIVVGTDFSPLADIGVRSAVVLAQRHQAERLHIVHVVGTSQASTIVPYSLTATQVESMQAFAVSQAEERMAALAIAAPPSLNMTREVRLGVPARELARVAEEIGADVLVVASHGYGGVKRFVLGSIASALIRTAHCPILVVGSERPAGEFQNVLAAVDLSPISHEVLKRALMMVSRPGGSLRAVSLFEHPLVHIPTDDLLPKYYSDDDVARLEKRQAEAVRRLTDDLDLSGVSLHIEAMSKAPPALVLLEVASIVGSDLIVVGTSGHNAWHRMIVGSTAGRVINEASCPVLVVPHDVHPDR